MKCSICNSNLNDLDNYCSKCGCETAVGYMYLKHNTIKEGYAKNINKRFKNLLNMFSLMVVLFTIITIIKGNNLFKPIFYLQKIINKQIYGYNTSLIKTDNIYNDIKIHDINDAYQIIKKDFDFQEFKCFKNNEVTKIEENLEINYLIASVNFCDISLNESKKIADVIEKVYKLFPSIKGYLTNITITNAKEKNEYVAYFEPKYEFVNINNDLNEYNKVNKTQILLNSYYYLNEDILNAKLSDVIGNDYVKSATFESLIAHELGHYITFVAYLKENNIDYITLVTKDNYNQINNLIINYDKGEYQREIVTSAYNNYLIKYNNVSFDSFILGISNYAGIKGKDYIYDETIAEAIHDYYLHDKNASKSSLEIVNILKHRLGIL